MDEIKSLETGEALVSFLNDVGEPSIVSKVTILPPQSKIGTIDLDTRNNIIKNDMFYNKYEKKISTEDITLKFNNKTDVKENNRFLKKESEVKTTRKKKSSLEKATAKVTNSALNTLGRKIGNSIFKGLFK